MKNFFKNLGLVFKNKNSTAQALWGAVGAPISIAKMTGKHQNFIEEFFNDPYLAGWLGGYINFMLINFFKITDATGRGEVLMKFYEFMDPDYFKGLDKFRKISEIIKGHQDKKITKDAVDSAFMTVAMFINSPSRVEFSSDAIYLKAKEFYESGEWAKKAHIQNRVYGKIMGESKKSMEMPEHQAIAFRIMETTFVEKLNKKFKVKSYI